METKKEKDLLEKQMKDWKDKCLKLEHELKNV